MTPIHHSKLKAGDLVYVQSKHMNKRTDIPFWEFLGEVTFVNKVGVSGKSNNNSFYLGDYFSNIFLIERGYFL